MYKTNKASYYGSILVSIRVKLKCCKLWKVSLLFGLVVFALLSLLSLFIHYALEYIDDG